MPALSKLRKSISPDTGRVNISAGVLAGVIGSVKTAATIPPPCGELITHNLPLASNVMPAVCRTVALSGTFVRVEPPVNGRVANWICGVVGCASKNDQ